MKKKKKKKLWAKIVYEREGVFLQRKFKTEAEAKAFTEGFDEAKDLTRQDTYSDFDQLDEYYVAVDSEPAKDEV